MTTKTHEIELSVYHVEVNEFCAWLKSKGHKASVGNTTDNLVDGWPTRVNGSAQDVLEALWDEYCAA